MDRTPRQLRTAHDEGLAASRRIARLSATIAVDVATIEDAQRLRYKVFGEEFGAELRSCDGLDVDEFDRFVRDAAKEHFAAAEYRAFPWLAFPHEGIERPVRSELPPLIRGYFRMGAQVCGEPAWDPEFGTADFLMLLAMDRIDGRNARHFALADGEHGRRP